jgi:ubiquinone/menaquinone biosynthesis C-methylase UbiE
MGAALLRRSRAVRLTLTDVDSAMLAAAARRVRRDPRATVVAADATRLPFHDRSLDVVVSYLMLHHVIAWEAAVAEAGRVLRPGGLFLGYGLVESRVTQGLHWLDGSPHRLIGPGQLESVLAAAGFGQTSVQYKFKQMVRFTASTSGRQERS